MRTNEIPRNRCVSFDVSACVLLSALGVLEEDGEDEDDDGASAFLMFCLFSSAMKRTVTCLLKRVGRNDALLVVSDDDFMPPKPTLW